MSVKITVDPDFPVLRETKCCSISKKNERLARQYRNVSPRKNTLMLLLRTLVRVRVVCVLVCVLVCVCVVGLLVLVCRCVGVCVVCALMCAVWHDENLRV